MKRIAITVFTSLLCCWGIWQSASIGFARTLSEFAASQRLDNINFLTVRLAGVTNARDAAERAVALQRDDAEGHAYLAEVCQQLEDYDRARFEFGRSVQLRPSDYYLWMLLGVTRDESQDQAGAVAALQQSVALAPSYAQPRWQLGNLLLRMGQFDQAFAEMRQAAESNPSLWPNIDDLAWGVYGHDVSKLVSVIRPETDTARMALSLFLARQGEGAAALEQFRVTRFRSEQRTESLIDELLKARAFREAFEVWAGINGFPSADAGAIRDGSFEGVLTVGQTGFGWQITPNLTNVILSIDEAEHQSGVRSLRLDFRGNSDPTATLVTQIILVKPQTRYHLGLFALSKEFVSAASPVITLVDASDPKKAVLAQSPPLLSDPNVWRELAIDFNTNPGTQAITITLARQPCANNPCPAFGTVWLDSVGLKINPMTN